MRDQNKLKAQQLEQEATRKLQGGCNGRSVHNVEDAADLYVKAGNLFKTIKMYDNAVIDFTTAADLHAQMDNSFQAAKLYKDASLLCKKNSSDANFIHYAGLAVELWCTSGNFSTAANLQKDVAAFYEEGNILDKALAAYEKAYDLASAADLEATAQSYQQKVADINALCGNFTQAADSYLELAQRCVKSTLGKYRVEEYITKCCLCHLAQTDIVGAKRALERGSALARLTKLTMLEECTELVSQSDLEAFKDVAQKIATACPDRWYSAMLMKIESAIEEYSEEDSVL